MRLLILITPYIRSPGESLDNILGTIDFRDLAVPLVRGELTAQVFHRALDHACEGSPRNAAT